MYGVQALAWLCFRKRLLLLAVAFVGGRAVMAERGIDVEAVLAQTAQCSRAAEARASALFDGFVKTFVP